MNKHSAEGFLTIKQAIEFCQERGKPLTYSGLIYAGLSNGFVTREGKGQPWTVNQAKLTQYLDLVVGTPPAEWYSIKEVSDILQCSVYTVYWAIRHGLIESQIYGVNGRGVMYVELGKVRDYISDPRNKGRNNE